MGIYVVDLTKDTIIVDGHVCKETEFKGIYRVQDDYIVNKIEWIEDERNRNLVMIYKSAVGNPLKKIDYICRLDMNLIDSFIAEITRLDYTYTYAVCMSFNRPPMIGGMWLC